MHTLLIRVDMLYGLLYWPIVRPTATIPDAYGGKLAALEKRQRLDGGKFNMFMISVSDAFS